MIHRIMLAAALLTVPAIVVAEPVLASRPHAQQAETPKPKKKKGLHKKGKAAAPKAEPKDSGAAK